MTSPRDARTAYALLKLRQAQLSKALKKIEPLIDQDPGDKNAARVGAAKVGVVAMSDPPTKALVSDVALLTKFVQETRPDEVEMVPVIREAFVTALLAQIDKTGELQDWDGHDVPGVIFGISKAPYQYFTAADGADEVLGVIEPGDLPEIDGVDLAGLLGVSREGGGV